MAVFCFIDQSADIWYNGNPDLYKEVTMRIPNELASKIEALSAAKREYMQYFHRLCESIEPGAGSDDDFPSGPSAHKDAAFIVEWCGEFLDSPEARLFWSVVSGGSITDGVDDRSILLFSSRFRFSEPCGDDPKAAATFSLASDGMYIYKEARPRIGEPGHSFSEYGWLTPSILARQLHPEYLRQMRRHLEGPQPFKFFIEELDRRVAAGYLKHAR